MKKTIPLLALLALAGCSIKEDRSACPAWLKIELSGKSLYLAGDRPVEVVVSDSSGADTLVLDSGAPAAWMAVERGPVQVESLLDNGARTQVAWGSQSDSLWAAFDRLALEREEESHRVDLHKRFATVWFIFDSSSQTDGRELFLEGSVAGTDITRMSPVAGDFRCRLDVRERTAAIRLPAQRSGSPLTLRCFTDGEQEWEWSLSEELAFAGYDWDAEDLEDARVFIHLAPLGFRIEIGNWRDGGEVTGMV